MKKFIATMLVLTAVPTVAQTAPSPVAGLAGHFIYQCSYKPNQGPLTVGPEYQDIRDGDGAHHNPAAASEYFQFGDKLAILSASTGKNLRGANFPQVFLKVRNETNNATATLPLEVSSENMRTTPSILKDIGTGVLFSLHPVSNVPHLGMTEADVYCAVGSPDHTNTDARGDDQLVYWHGSMYVYINKAGRVSNIQTRD